MKRLFAAACAALVSGFAVAQSYPLKTVRFIMPHVPGGPHDTVARGMAQAFSQSMGQPFVVENRPGGDGIVGLTACAAAPPDGYSLCLGYGSPFTLNPVLYSKLAYDTARDFAPIMHLGFLYSAVIAHPSVTANSLRELIEQSKAKPKSITWGVFGPGSITNLYVEWMNKAQGAGFYSVSYKSAIPAATAVMAGEVQVALLTVGQAAGQAKAGKVKPLAVIGGAQRSSAMPDLPSMPESGVDLVLSNWWGLFGRTGTPMPVLQRLHGETKKLVDDPQFSDKFFRQQGFEMQAPAGESMEAFAAFLRADRETNLRVVKLTGVRIDQ
jgi:tripartite-type tricarboxylate transporter receptor subunit TctC